MRNREERLGPSSNFLHFFTSLLTFSPKYIFKFVCLNRRLIKARVWRHDLHLQTLNLDRDQCGPLQTRADLHHTGFYTRSNHEFSFKLDPNDFEFCTHSNILFIKISFSFLFFFFLSPIQKQIFQHLLSASNMFAVSCQRSQRHKGSRGNNNKLEIEYMITISFGSSLCSHV